MEILRKLHLLLLGLSILFSPFISSLGVHRFGPLGMEGSFYPAALGLLVWLVETLFFQKKIYIPKAIYIFYAFLTVMFVSGAVHFLDITELQSKGVNGTSRFLIQIGAMVFYYLVLLYVYNIIREEQNSPVLFFQRWICLSFALAGTYSLFELGKISGNAFSADVMTAVDSLFRSTTVTGDIERYFRIRSLAGEASYFGMYIAVLLPWILGKCFLGRSKYPGFFFFVFGYVIVLVLFSQSRTAYMVMAIETVAFFILFWRRVWAERLRFGAFVFLFFIVAMISFDYVSDSLPEVDVSAVYESLLSNDNLSNVARYGSQRAGWNMFMDHPLLGVGFGMYGFYASQYYPAEAWRSLEIVMWGQDGTGWPWPPVHSLYARILAELGVVGLIVYLVLLLSLFSGLWRVCVAEDAEQRTEARILMLALLGIVLQGFNIDTFRNIPMWIVFALVLGVTMKGREKT
ncbi:O-antigen ligase family protein [Mitsuokella sp. oral taxon 131]|uniref:O-antigen ligase family protein n=1 Tax=Mitsuokella sp. oral taxon 131 TaxID=1321780 RepID=UPI0003AE6818|nr:O-antigen ligase family protein [Mitsuokella sp. oral taxon 131]ERL03710.1 O-antigen polymerase [Mitsuokella sp. oral taxon 131 str. W9106]